MVNNNIVDIVNDVVKSLLMFLVEEAAVRVREKEEAILVEIDVKDASLLIGRGGRILDALQMIVYRIVRRRCGEVPSIVIDVNGYRQRREEDLSKMARDIAERVKKSGKSVLLEPMNAWERRVIHMAVKDKDEIETESEDTEGGRSVRIRPSDEAKLKETSEEE